MPENNNPEKVALKVSAINQLYRAGVRVIDITAMVKRLCNPEFENLLDKHSPEAVDYIAAPINGRKYYSFATKYCNWHQHDHYPVYDTVVKKLLIAYQKEFEFHKFKSKDLEKYSNFKALVEKFRNHFDLDYSFKEVDKFLWYYGVEVFQPDK